MGRLMDAVLAVSVLAMVSVVALADCMMSCCGVGSEAMSQMLGGLIMVRSRKTGRYKNGCNLRTIGLIYFKLGQNVDEGVPYH